MYVIDSDIRSGQTGPSNSCNTTPYVTCFYVCVGPQIITTDDLTDPELMVKLKLYSVLVLVFFSVVIPKPPKSEPLANTPPRDLLGICGVCRTTALMVKWKINIQCIFK